MKLDVRRAESRDTLELVDQVERRRVTVRFPDPVSPVPADAGAFVYPIDRAVRIETDALSVEPSDLVAVLDGSGEVRTHLAEPGAVEVPPGEYYVDVSSHLKTYLWVDTPDGFEIEVTDGGEASPVAHLDFGGQVDVRLGVRSLHERPEATVTTTRAPTDVMAAVSAFGSALKDTGPDRSFPSLRGHPPDVELGNELHVPDELAPPATGVVIELPPAYEYIFPAAPR